MKEGDKVIDNDIRFRKLIENSFSGITLLDHDLNIIYRNPSAERITGWHITDRVKNTIDDLTHPDDRDQLNQVLQQVLDQPGLTKTATYRTIHPGGRYIWLECRFTNMFDEYDVNAIGCNFIDITEKKQAEERLIESERFISTITDNVPALIAYWTADLHCLFANNPHLEWFNKQPHEMKNITKQELLGDKEFKLHQKHIDAVLRGEPQSFERNFYKSDGTTIYTQTQYLPDKDGDTVKGFYSFISDITNIKLAELEINKQTEQITDLLENITDGFIALDENMCYIYANKAVGKMIGIEPASLIGKNVWEVFPDAVGSNTYNAIQTAFTEKRYICNEDYYEPLKLWQENRAYPSGDGVSLFVRDITQKKHKEQEIEQLNERFSLISKATNDALFEWNFEKQEIWWSESYFTLFGFDPQLPIPPLDEWLARLLPESRPLIDTTLKDIYEKGLNNWQVEVSYYRTDGTKGTLLNRGFVIRDEHNKPVRMLGSYQDITHQKNEQQQKALLNQAINESLKERNNILESIGDVFFALDKNWIVTYWNNVAEKVLRRSRSDVINKDFRKIYEYALNYLPLTKYHEAIETHKAVHFEHYSAVLATWFEISAYPNSEGLSVYMKDVTDRKNAETTAKLALDEKISILESIGDAFFAIDKNWTVTYWNNTAEKVLQVPKANILNHNLWEVFSTSVGSLSYKKYHRALKTNKAVHFEDHYPVLNKWYEISAYPSNNGLSVYFKDITERKISENRLTELNKALEKHAKELAVSNAELEQFAYVASHDLQEPLRMVTGFLTQIERKYGETLDAKGKQYIHFAVDGAKRMRQIILDLLEFSRIGRTDEHAEEVDLNIVVNEIIILYRKQIDEKKAKITFSNLPLLNTHKTPVRQVFQNLISNGLKYQKPGNAPLIEIEYAELPRHYHFSVHDNGIGIDAEYFDTIFIIFQRLHNKEEYSGTGMGLAVTKKIVESLGGKIWLESEQGKGSTFHFTILKK